MKREKIGCYCINLRRAANAVSRLYDAHLEPLGLTVNQFSLLRAVGRIGPCSVTRLAEDTGLERTTLVRTVEPLIRRGLVRDAAGTGRRARRLELTEQGRALAREGLERWKDAQRALEQRVGEEEMASLLALLERAEGE